MISVTYPTGQVVIIIIFMFIFNRLADTIDVESLWQFSFRGFIMIETSVSFPSSNGLTYLSQRVIGSSKQLSQSEASMHNRDQDDFKRFKLHLTNALPILDRMVDCKTWAWASSFVTRASRKLSHLPHRASRKKVLVLPCSVYV